MRFLIILSLYACTTDPSYRLSVTNVHTLGEEVDLFIYDRHSSDLMWTTTIIFDEQNTYTVDVPLQTAAAPIPLALSWTHVTHPCSSDDVSVHVDSPPAILSAGITCDPEYDAYCLCELSL